MVFGLILDKHINAILRIHAESDMEALDRVLADIDAGDYKRARRRIQRRKQHIAKRVGLVNKEQA